MGVRTWRTFLAAVVTVGAVLLPAVAGAQGRIQQNAYEQGYHEGLHHGERDGRAGLTFNPGHDARLQVRGPGQGAFRQGYLDGYRLGYDRYSSRGRGRGARQNRGVTVWSPRGYADPFTVGFDRGFEKGLEDGRDGDRYDPVRHRNYRDADEGYRNEHGSREAYRTNYRAGFRQGYEDGYRQGTRSRRR